jgi:hypothetical protein
VSAIGTVIIAAGVIVTVQMNNRFGLWSLATQFQSFRVTVDNQSDYDLSSIETGVVTSASAGGETGNASKDELGTTLHSGRRIKIRPQLSLSGEGGIYLKYTDPRKPGAPVTIGVCSYTESLSGYSKVTIKNDEIEIEENCS